MTRKTRMAALLFLYRDVLHLQLTELDAVRAERLRRLPVVLSRVEPARQLLSISLQRIEHQTREQFRIEIR